jgi:hypothetical protein
VWDLSAVQIMKFKKRYWWLSGVETTKRRQNLAWDLSTSLHFAQDDLRGEADLPTLRTLEGWSLSIGLSDKP